MNEDRRLPDRETPMPRGRIERPEDGAPRLEVAHRSQHRPPLLQQRRNDRPEMLEVAAPGA